MERFHVLEVSAKVLFILVNIVKVRSRDNSLLYFRAADNNCLFSLSQSFDRRSVLSAALKVHVMYSSATIYTAWHRITIAS